MMRSHTLIVPFSEGLTAYRPSGLNASRPRLSYRYKPRHPGSVRPTWHSASRSQSFSASSPAVTARRESGVAARASDLEFSDEWPRLIDRRTVRELRGRTYRRSSEQKTACCLLPDPARVKLLRAAWMSRNTWSSRPASRSHSFNVSSADDDTANRPSGVAARASDRKSTRLNSSHLG